MPDYQVHFRSGHVMRIHADNAAEARKIASERLRQRRNGKGSSVTDVYNMDENKKGGGQVNVTHGERKSETWGEYLDRGGKSPRYLDKRGKSTTGL